MCSSYFFLKCVGRFAKVHHVQYVNKTNKAITVIISSLEIRQYAVVEIDLLDYIDH